jgi:flagellar transcriptional activator FlhC
MVNRLSHAERHIRALALAKACVALGARIRTVSYVTGLPHGQLTQLFYSDCTLSQRGRAPDSSEWYHSANLLNRTEASIFLSIYRRIRDLGFGPTDALVAGYRHYLTVCRTRPRIHFDRAFDLASHMDGLWTARTPSFSLVTCPTCTSQYVTAVCAHPATNHECPFCKLVHRFRRDPRLQTSFPVNTLPDITAIPSSVLALAKHLKPD